MRPSEDSMSTTSVHTMGNSHLLRVPVNIQGKILHALIDTGSEVTILKDTIFNSLINKPDIIRVTAMQGIVPGMKMICKITKPTNFFINRKEFTHRLHVAPMDFDMLLGYDFLEKYQAILDTRKQEMTLSGNKVPLVCGAQQQGSPCPLYICPRSGDLERTWKTGPEDLLCPVTGCPVVTWGVWRHVMSEHLSPMFGINFEQKWLTNIHFQRYRGQMTMVLAQWLCHSETATGQELMDFLQHEVRLGHTCKIQNKDMPWYREVCRTMGWATHKVYHIDKANSPVCVLNWRVMASILHYLTPQQQELAYGEEFDPKRPVNEELLFEMNARFWPSARPIQTGSHRRKIQDEEGALMKAIQAQKSGTRQSHYHPVMSQLGMPGKTAQSRDSVIAILSYQGQRFMTSGATVHELKRLAKARFRLTRPFELSYEGISVVDSLDLTLLGPRFELSVEEL